MATPLGAAPVRLESGLVRLPRWGTSALSKQQCEVAFNQQLLGLP